MSIHADPIPQALFLGLDDWARSGAGYIHTIWDPVWEMPLSREDVAFAIDNRDNESDHCRGLWARESKSQGDWFMKAATWTD